jgi:FkbM family methyltransferase
MKKWLKNLIESNFGIRLYKGWFPRGMDLAFDRGRLISAEVPVMFDVGANVGDTALELAARHPAAVIHAFEPVRETFALLAANIHAVTQITGHQFAVGALSETSEIRLYEGTVNNSLKPHEGSVSRGTQQVTVVTLDDFCRQQGIERIDFLKIDTEGFDLEVVRGANILFQQHRIGVVVAEVGFSPDNMKHVSFCVFLQEMQIRGMELFGIYDQRREFSGVQQLRRADCMFVCRHHRFPGLDISPDV